MDGARVSPLSRSIRAMHDHNRHRRLRRRIGRRWSFHCRVRVDIAAAWRRMRTIAEEARSPPQPQSPPPRVMALNCRTTDADGVVGRSVVCPSVAVSHAGFPLYFRMAEDANKSLWPPAADATTPKKPRPGFRTLNTGNFHLNDHRLPLLLERQCSAHRHAHVPFSTLPFSKFSPLSLSCSLFVRFTHSLSN